MTHPDNGDAAHGHHLVVCPVMFEDPARACIGSLLAEGSAGEVRPTDVLVVDNSRDGWAVDLGVAAYRDRDGHNLGVARSWNVGVRVLLDSKREYLTLLSASMLFGPLLHTSWTRQLLAFWGENVIEAEGHSWHLIAFHRRVFETVGLFDENFHAYFEALDFSFRMRQVGWEGGWRRVWVNALSRFVAFHAQHIAAPADPLLAYYREKWGGNKHEERWTRPFGDRPLDYWPESTIPELAERYGWGPRHERWW